MPTGSHVPHNKGLERTRPAPNGVTGPCRSTQCSTGTGTSRAELRFSLRVVVLVFLFTVAPTPAWAIFCMPFSYHVAVQIPDEPGWFLKAVAVPEREAMKLERETLDNSPFVKVIFSSAQQATSTSKFSCSWEPKAFLLTAQKDGKTLEYRVRIPEDLERVPGTQRSFRSKAPLALQPPKVPK